MHNSTDWWCPQPFSNNSQKKESNKWKKEKKKHGWGNMCDGPAVESRILTYLQSSRVRLEATCRVLRGHTALDGISIDPYLVLFQAQLGQAATFTHSQLSVYQIHTGWERERKRNRDSGYIAFGKQQKHILPRATKITSKDHTLSLQTSACYQARPVQRSGITTDSLEPFSTAWHSSRCNTPRQHSHQWGENAWDACLLQ